jgi:hypothetical protein
MTEIAGAIRTVPQTSELYLLLQRRFLDDTTGAAIFNL